MASAFQTHQAAESHAKSILRANGDDANSEGVLEFMEKRLAIYPGPYRASFKATIEARRKWQEKRTRFEK